MEEDADEEAADEETKGSREWLKLLNKKSRTIIPGALAEPCLAEAAKEDHFQFERY